MCDEWAAEFKEAFTRAPGASTRLAREGVSMLSALPAAAERSVLLCTDLHSWQATANTEHICRQKNKYTRH